MTTDRLPGLTAAVHTPFAADGSLALAVVEAQAARLLADGVGAAFVGGTTGESHSLARDERLALTERWAAVAKGTALKVVVHVGANSLPDAQALTAQAGRLGAAAVSAVAPSYFKPPTVDALVRWCGAVAGAAPDTPFYYYDIPQMTGVTLPVGDFLDAAGERLPSLAGVKFSSPDLIAFQVARHAAGGRFEVLWGVDEMLLGAVALGARGAVGSTYNFAAATYHRLLKAFAVGDLGAARREQFRAVQLVRTLLKRGFMASAKAFMGFRGVPVGPPRLPLLGLSDAAATALRTELEAGGWLDTAG